MKRAVLALALAGLLLSGCNRPGTHTSRPVTTGIRFRDVAESLGVTFQAGLEGKSPLNISEITYGGAAFVMSDGDEYPDLVFTGLNGAGLYLNEQGHGFHDATAGSGLDRVGKDLQGVAAADYDGDGHADLLVTRLHGCALLKWIAPAKYREMTAVAGLGSVKGWTSSAAFADVNGDGVLDLYLGRYVQFDPRRPQYHETRGVQLSLGPSSYEREQGVFFLGQPGGKFREATGEAGLGDAQGKVLGATFADYDEDGDQDLYLANDEMPGDFYQNDGKGHFRNVAMENGTVGGASGRSQAGMGVDWGDYDADGQLDLVVTTFWNEPKSLYRQTPDHLFTESSQLAGLLGATLRWTAFGVTFTDWDNDGWLDLMIANGHVEDQRDKVDPAVGYRQPTQVFRNEKGIFRDVSETAGPDFARKIVGRALVAADYDLDGKQDAVIANLGGPPLILHNESRSGNWVTVRLQAPPPNRDGIGALVTLEADGRKLLRTVQPGRSFMGAFLPEAAFGVGTAAQVSGTVRWPDGTTQPLPSLKLNSVNTVRHP